MGTEREEKQTPTPGTPGSWDLLRPGHPEGGTLTRLPSNRFLEMRNPLPTRISRSLQG